MTRLAAWLVLLGAGITMASFQMWHALHSGMPLYLALLTGVVPVLIAMGLSHVVAHSDGGWPIRTVTFLVMIGAMVLSVRATGYVVRLAFGDLWPLFGAVVDSAALVALQVILAPAPEAAQSAVSSAVPEAADSATTEAAAEPSAEPPAEPPAEPSRVPSAGPRQSAMRTDKSQEAEQGRAAYRRSVRTGRPLSDRALGELFGKSRTWGASRIREAEAGPHPVGRTA